MLARNGDGDWLPLQQVDDLGPGGFAQLCGPDLARLLNLEQPYLVAGFEPDLPGAPDAVCLTPSGDIALVVSTFGRDDTDALLRLVQGAAALHELAPHELCDRCANLRGSSSAGSWVASRLDGVDAADVDAGIEQALAEGRVELVAVTPAGPGELAPVLRFLDRGPGDVRCYEVGIRRAGDMQVADAADVDIDDERDHDVDAEADTESTTPSPRSAPVLLATGADTAPPVARAAVGQLRRIEQPVAQEAPPATGPQEELAEPTADITEAAETTAATTDAPEDAETTVDTTDTTDAAEDAETTATEDLVVTDSSRTEFRATSMARSGWKLVQYYAEQVDMQLPDTAYVRRGDLVVQRTWQERSGTRTLLQELDSAGQLTFWLADLPTDVRDEFVCDLARSLASGDEDELAGCDCIEVSLVQELGDESLLDYLAASLAEAAGVLTPRSNDDAPATDEFFNSGDGDASDEPTGNTKLPWPRRQSRHTRPAYLDELRRRKAS